MGVGEDTAAGRMEQLHRYFREHPVTGPSARRSTPTTPSAPVNLSVVDHISAAVTELADYTRTVNPGAGPLPDHVTDVYRWCVENTDTAPLDARLRRDTIVYRQRLEHAIAMGDTDVVRPHRCPACRTFGLTWPGDGSRKTLCTNGNCLTKDGLSRRWTLARLAYEHIARTSEKTLRACAT